MIRSGSARTPERVKAAVLGAPEKCFDVFGAIFGQRNFKPEGIACIIRAPYVGCVCVLDNTVCLAVEAVVERQEAVCGRPFNGFLLRQWSLQRGPSGVCPIGLIYRRD